MERRRATDVHPADQLTRGMAGSFPEACALVASGALEDAIAGDSPLLRQHALDAAAARTIYERAMYQARQEITRQLREAGLDDYARAFATGDYARLGW